MDEIRNLILKIEQLKQEQKYKEAISLIEEALLKYNSDYRLYEELADIYLFKGENTKALKSINFALDLNSESATGNYLKGFILLGKNKAKEAIKLLEKSNNILGNNAEVLRNLGWAYTLDGNAEKGIILLKRALNIAPNDNFIVEDLAMALISVGNFKEGQELLKSIGKNIP